MQEHTPGGNAKRKTRFKIKSTKITIKHEFIGDKSLTDAFVPIIYEDIRKEMESSHTFDKTDDSI